MYATTIEVQKKIMHIRLRTFVQIQKTFMQVQKTKIERERENTKRRKNGEAKKYWMKEE